MNGNQGRANGPCDADAGLGGWPVGLLAKLMAAVRPQFRAEDLVFDPRDPVFGGPACAVAGCDRPERKNNMCVGHRQRWLAWGKPDLAVFVTTTTPYWYGHRALEACVIVGCQYGLQGNGMCSRHMDQWVYSGRPDLSRWQVSGTQAPPGSPLPSTCRIGHCDLWARGTSAFCCSHDDRWRGRGRPEVEGFIASYADPGPGTEHIDLRCLPTQLRLEIAYALQCRADEQTARVIPARVQAIVRTLAGTQLTSLLDASEGYWANLVAPVPVSSYRKGWRTFVLDTRRRVEVLAIGQGWDVEYPRQVWRLRNLGIDQTETTIDFGGIPQPWLTALAKRWARWQLTTGLSAGTARAGARAVARFAGFLARESVAVDRLADVDRPLLERYLADVRSELGGRRSHLEHVAAVSGFLRAIRQHRWDDTLPASALLFAEDYPKRGELLPRALAAQVMAQVEQPANLDRWDNLTHRLITLILIRCGLRVSSAVTLPFDCIAADADGAPYLRYRNTKMKREALVPIDEELHREIVQQQQRTLARFPGGTPV
ncbi:MAG TPA: hypothetical protein VHN80_30580, partial [Kineosporiaceae bacterium]|nr:hypothetical protein [Kineosporiaceae bacterium]